MVVVIENFTFESHFETLHELSFVSFYVDLDIQRWYPYSHCGGSHSTVKQPHMSVL